MKIAYYFWLIMMGICEYLWLEIDNLARNQKKEWLPNDFNIL